VTASDPETLPAPVDHSAQIQRIKTKLAAARKADRELKVFGASSHRYRIDEPASEREVHEFEERYSVRLPACYRAFVTRVGNGGQSWQNSAAGPYYGIYPLGEGAGELVHRPELFLSMPAILRPGLTDEEWADETKRMDQEGLSDQDYEEERGRIFSGILPLGTQGCTYLHALVLNGPHAGKVANLSIDFDKPKFTFERNFLDWYERWLDEVISGELSRQVPSSFGFTMGGDDANLMRVFAGAEDLQTRFDAVEGLGRLDVASEATCRTLLGLCDDPDAGLRRLALRMLTKFDYPMAHESLRAHFMGDDDDCLAACEGLHCHGEGRTHEWADLLKSRLPKVNSQETFRFICYLLVSSGVDYGDDLRPFCTHPDEDFRTIAFYSLGKLTTKRQRVDLFLIGLEDVSPKVVHATVQALEGVRDQRLVAAYVRVRERFKTDEHYVLTNLRRREQEMGGGLFGGLRKRFGK
jgi:hypothetical protein